MNIKKFKNSFILLRRAYGEYDVYNNNSSSSSNSHT